MRIVTWNVNGIRAILKKEFVESVRDMNPDVLCLQETKAQDEQVREALFELSDYDIYINSAERKGYSGTAVLTKAAVKSVTNDLGIDEHDAEGRLITAEYEDFYLINTYVPNSGSGLVRLPYRKTWDGALLKHMKSLEKKKPVVLCGDLNVAHRPIDLANPKSNYNKTAGYTQEEIDGMDTLLGNGFVDVWRNQHPEEVKYSWWSYRFNSRAKNVGWRLDYFVVSQGFLPRVKASEILNEYHGSDHCPVVIEIE